jgi:hypothetical protein
MTYQQCRYKGKVEKIPIREIHGQSYILLNDVHDRFPDVTYFKYNNEPIPFEHDDNHHRLNPLRIKANIEIIIDCHKSTYDDKATSKFDNDVKQKLFQIDNNLKQTLENTEIIKATTAAILRQAFELAEYTMPRLFIVLPDYTPHYNLTQWLHLNYRLYFLCECENDDERHLAFHDGYEVKQPREFFLQFGPYLYNMLTIVKYAISVGGLIVPHLSFIASEISTSAIPKDRSSWNRVGTRVQWLAEILKEARESSNISTDTRVQHLEGAALRGIESFLKKTDEHRKFGNLFRSVTNDGHVRWVCIQHHEQHYSKNAIKSLHEEFRKLGGEIKEDIAIVEGKASEELPGMLDVLKKGFSFFSVVLKDSSIKEKHFHELLSFVSQQSTIHNLQLENINVLSNHRNKRKQIIISELNKTVKANEKLQIQYSFTKPLSEFASEILHIITETNSRLIFQLRSREDTPSLELTGAKETGFTLTINNSNEKYDINYHTAIKNIFTLISNITKIVLHNGIISDRIWSCFFDSLTTNVSLQELILDCQLTLEQTKELSLSLRDNRTLKTLQMSNMWKQDDELQGFEEIFQAFQMNTGLFELNLSCYTDLIQLDFIAKYLLQNQSLRVLRLPKCQIQQNTDIKICESFFQTTSLNTLSLELISTNCEASLERLARAMNKNETLDTLELKGLDCSAIFHRKNHIPNSENNPVRSSAARTKPKKCLGLFRCHRSKHRHDSDEEITTPLERNHRKSVSVEPFYQLCHHPPLYKEIQEMTQNFKLEELEINLEDHEK